MNKQPIDQIEQEFSCAASGPLRVQLAASSTQWQSQAISTAKAGDGIWQAKLQLPPGTHRDRFIVDGERHDDPTCTLRISNQFGISNMRRDVRAA